MTRSAPDDRLARALAHLRRGETQLGARLVDLVLKDRPRDPAALGLAGAIALQRGDRGLAIERLGRALSLNPNDAAAHSNLALAYLGEGRTDEAERHLGRALKLNPNDAAAYTNLGDLLRRRFDHAAAEAAFRRAAALNPNLAEAHRGLARSLSKLGRPREALEHARRSVALNPRLVDGWRALAGIEDTLGNYEAAVAAFQQAIALDPRDPGTQSELAATHLAFGRRDAAIAGYRAALAIDPTRASDQRMLGNLSAEAESLAAQVARYDAAGRDDERIQLGFTLGRAFEERGDYARAFRYLDAANRLVRAGLRYDRADSDTAFAEIEAAFTPELFARLAGSGLADETPIFVLGMPRSSTTLVEQILASHPDVTGAGELAILRELVAASSRRRPLRFPELVEDLGPADYTRIGEDYVRAIRAYSDRTRFITDKMPGNFMLIGIIALALPKARIIHCVRDPADTALSLWRNLFSSHLAYAYDLGEAGHYHRLYQALMAHWHRVLPGRIYDISYEALVDDQEGETRRLLDWCDLDFRPECLDFWRTERPVHTASAAQVRNPISRSSIGLAARYGDLLAPLHAALNGDDRR